MENDPASIDVFSAYASHCRPCFDIPYRSSQTSTLYGMVVTSELYYVQ